MTRAAEKKRLTAIETPEEETYWVTDAEQIAALVSPRRHEIIDHLAAFGPMSIKVLAQQIGARPSALYHHIELLKKVGMVVVSGYRVVNRKRETLYATRAPRMRLLRALADPAHRDIFKEIVSALTRQMDRDFDRALSSDRKQVLGKERNLGFLRLISAPDPETLAQINHHLAVIAELMLQSGASAGDGGEHIAFACTICPIGPDRGD